MEKITVVINKSRCGENPLMDGALPVRPGSGVVTGTTTAGSDPSLASLKALLMVLSRGYLRLEHSGTKSSLSMAHTITPASPSV